MWNHAKKSMKQLKRPTSLISHWFPVEMVQNRPNLCKHKLFFICRKIFKRYPGMPYESWRPAVSENVVHHRTIFRFSVGDLIYLVFQRSQPWSLSIYPEGVDGRMKVQSSMISFVRLGRDQANSEDAKCCLEWWCAWLCYRSIISHSINTCTAGPADCQRKIRN